MGCGLDINECSSCKIYKKRLETIKHHYENEIEKHVLVQELTNFASCYFNKAAGENIMTPEIVLTIVKKDIGWKEPCNCSKK